MSTEGIQEVITIGRNDYIIQTVTLNQADLKFYPKNPRVYSVLYSMDSEPSQDEIEELMCEMEHVKELKLSIKSNGGLIDPLIVRAGELTVLEGNSRLAAHRILSKEDPCKWAMVKCKLLPADISEDAIFTLLGQYHIIGRKDWEPFEQASYLYRRKTETKLPVESMADELGISKQKANQMIKVIEFMTENEDLNKRNWSYYEEYLKNAPLKAYRESNPDLDQTIVTSIKTGQVKEASDIRLLGKIAQVGDRQSKRIMQKITSGDKNLYDGYMEVQEAGKFDDVIKKLKGFKALICTSTFEKQISSTPEIYDQAAYEIKKIARRLDKLVKEFEKP